MKRPEDVPLDARTFAAYFTEPPPDDGVEYTKIAAAFHELNARVVSTLSAFGGSVAITGQVTGTMIEPYDFVARFAALNEEDRRAAVGFARVIILALKHAGYKVVPEAES